MHKTVKARNQDGVDIPKIQTLEGLSHVAMWKSGSDPRASAWNDNKIVQGRSWVNPRENETLAFEVLKGSYIVHFSWFEGNFGHFFDDSLTQIAYLRNQVSDDTKWLLCDTPLARSVLEFMDPDLFSRVHWVKMGLPVSVEGTLHVSIPPRIPLFSGCCRPYDHLREWISEKLPENPSPKKIVYYSRDSTDVHHKRKVNSDHEKLILERIRHAMLRHNIQDELIIFNGQNENGDTLSIREQFHIFRAARTIIGPHGAGMLGNIVWTNPLPDSCAQRTQVIEFIPGINSTQVQPLYRSLFIRWRKWPLDFHVLLYQPESTKKQTFIDLDSLDDALDDTWGGRAPVPQVMDQ